MRKFTVLFLGLLVATICVAGLASAFANEISLEEPACYFGNCREQIRNIADIETDRFMKALNATVNGFFEDDEARKIEFIDLLKEKLGLAAYSGTEQVLRSSEEIVALEKLRAKMEPFEDGEVKFRELALTLQLKRTEPVAEGGAEGEGL